MVTYQNVYNADYKNNMVLYTTKNGDIYLDNKYVLNNNIPCYIKYGDIRDKTSCIFTTTGANGLKVFDLNKETLLHSYRAEKLYDHSVNNNLVVTWDDYNIKLYDIREKEMIKSYKQTNLKKVEWYKEYLMIYTTDNELTQFDMLNEKILKSFKEVSNFANSEYLFIETNKEIFISDLSFDSGKKKSNYKGFVGLKGASGIGGFISKDKLQIEEINKTKTAKKEEFKHIKKLKGIFIGDSLFIYADDVIQTFENLFEE